MHFSTVYPVSTIPPPAYKKCLSLFTCLSVRLSVCLSARQSVCLSVCIRKQVSITRKFHKHYDDETQYTDSHTTARKHSKLISQLFCSFPQQNDFKTILTSTKNASLIVTDFLAMIDENEQPRTASLCRGWAMLENDFILICS